jgi:predicted RNA-binding Zn-ribbon protein involved in translation (DUF1610 family)
MSTVTEEEWNAEGVRLFGEDRMGWRFACPSCGHVASVRDWRDAGAPENAVAFSCVGRWTGAKAEIFDKKGPCNYAGGGLFQLNPTKVTRADGGESSVFAFAPLQD